VLQHLSRLHDADNRCLNRNGLILLHSLAIVGGMQGGHGDADLAHVARDSLNTSMQRNISGVSVTSRLFYVGQESSGQHLTVGHQSPTWYQTDAFLVQTHCTVHFQQQDR